MTQNKLGSLGRVSGVNLSATAKFPLYKVNY